jgi:crossover junction endonuclease MUS81
MITIQIDYREADLLKNIQHLIESVEQFKNLVVETKNLSLGDISLIEKREKEEESVNHLLIERKTISDLVSSIKDGRYNEQSFRLNELAIHNHNILYLIEGDLNKRNFFKENKEEKRMILSALFSLNYYKGFSVIRTLSIEETALFICNTSDKMIKSIGLGIKPFFKVENQRVNSSEKEETNETNESNEKDKDKDKEYVNVMKKTKKEHITRENIGEIFLSQIPSISSVTACAIMKKGKNISNLIQSIEKDKDFLKDISYLDYKGKSRKISSKSIQNIYSFLCDETC